MEPCRFCGRCEVGGYALWHEWLPYERTENGKSEPGLRLRSYYVCRDNPDCVKANCKYL